MPAVLFRVVTFIRSFHLPGHPDPFPPGTYRVLIEEAAMDGPGFSAVLRVSTQLVVQGRGVDRGQGTLFATSDEELSAALALDLGEGRE